MPRLTDDEIDAALKERSDWTREGDAIVRTVAFKGFMRPLLLANAIGHRADRMNHHPELTIRWGSLTVRLWTHDDGGLTEADFTLAGRIDALIDA
jgi:4a-hydroxytetrahydrobiopterin dehydratase